MSVFEIFLLSVIWVAPLIFIRRSKGVEWKEKLAWILLTVFVSWFAWVLFVLLAPIKKNRN